MVQHLTAARVAEGPGVAWDTADSAVPAEGKRLLINEPARFGGVAVTGAGEHLWRHASRGGKYVSVIIDLAPVRDGTGPARLPGMAEGHSEQAFTTWLADRVAPWRDGAVVVAMDGFTGFKTGAAGEVPHAVAVTGPFHVVRLAGDALGRSRRRVRLQIHRHRGFKDDPLCKTRRTLQTGAGLLTGKQTGRISALFAEDAHVEVEATRGTCQRMVAACRHEDRRQGRELMLKLTDSISSGVPKALTEIVTLGRTLNKRAADVLA